MPRIGFVWGMVTGNLKDRCGARENVKERAGKVMAEQAGCGLKKNDLFELAIEDLGNDGEGIGRYNGYTFFVKDAVPGDVIRARALKFKKNYGYARVEEILAASADRVTPRCPVARQCGGCQLQHLSYERQLVYKQEKIRNCLERIGGVANPCLEPMMGMEVPYYYRNKAQFPVGVRKDGRVAIGFYAGHSHNIVDTEECCIQAPVNAALVAAVREYLEECKVAPYQEETHTGLVRHILTRVGFATGEIMVCLVVNGTSLPRAEALREKLEKAVEEWNRKLEKAVKEWNRREGSLRDKGESGNWREESLREKEESGNQREESLREKGESGNRREESLREKWESGNGREESLQEKWESGNREEEWEVKRAQAGGLQYKLVSLCLNVNTERTNVILGSRVVPLYGDPYITDYIGAVKYRISPLSFYQVNPGQTHRLYEQALAYADLKGGETVWDLYCGIGTISLFLAQKAGKVYGVEVVPQAVEDARKNAELNGIANAEFFEGAAEDVLPQKYEESGGKMRADVIVVDPPRAGCAQGLLETIVRMQPERVVYVSCDPATLARDVKFLGERGFAFVKGRGVDQFGMGGHVECVCLLENNAY